MTEIALRQTGGQEVQHYTAPTSDQVVELLQRASAYDRRTFGHSEKAAWTSASQIGGWTFEEACRAIDHHKATSAEYLEPHHVTRWIQLERRKSRLQGHVATNGARIPSHAEAVEMWVTEMRKAGGSPTEDQMRQASEMVASMLDGVDSAVHLIRAIHSAARKFTSRIDWALEKIGRDDEKLWTNDMPTDIAVEYIPDELLHADFAASHADFPAQWREYDPFGTKAARRAEQRNGILLGGIHLPEIEPTPRDLPDWVVAFHADDRARDNQGLLRKHDFATREEHYADARAWRDERDRVAAWLAQDKEAWRAERLPIVRQWYLDHPDKRPDAIWYHRSGSAYDEAL
jgi:hypothetical protein